MIFELLSNPVYKWNTRLEILNDWPKATTTETPVLWPPDSKNWLIGKDPDAGKDWRREEKGTTEDEVVGWHHRLDEREFEQALGVSDGQRSLLCCSPWGAKESDVTEHLKVTTGRIRNSRSNSFDSKFCLANPGKLLERDSAYSLCLYQYHSVMKATTVAL